MTSYHRTIFHIIVCSILVCGCEKDWLDAKPEKALLVPSSIADYQAILDNTTAVTGSSPGEIGFNTEQISLDEIGAGDFYVTTARWSSASDMERYTYIWARDIYGSAISVAEWNYPYQRIFHTNIVLDGLKKITPKVNEKNAWSNAKGAALFFRSYNHFNVAQHFCLPYNKNTAAQDLGIPIRLTPDFNEVTVRSSVLQTYNRIIEDLKEAVTLLPVDKPDIAESLYKLRPTKAAAYGMLARVYLSMSEHENALKYADSCLKLYNYLINYNPPFSLSGNQPFPRFNREVIFQMRLKPSAFFLTSRLIVDSTLYKSYNTDDLRRSGFFRVLSGNNTFKGSYDQSAFLYSGLATDEIYLISAECNARVGNVSAAMQDLNTLMINRWESSSFVPISAVDANEALSKILTERRKELIYRGLRWTDLRRLNMEPQFVVNLTRVIDGNTYTLPANDINYTLPIPRDVIQLSGIQQNPRN